MTLDSVPASPEVGRGRRVVGRLNIFNRKIALSELLAEMLQKRVRIGAGQKPANPRRLGVAESSFTFIRSSYDRIAASARYRRLIRRGSRRGRALRANRGAQVGTTPERSSGANRLQSPSPMMV